MANDGSVEKSDGEKLLSGIREMIEGSTPDDKDWCPKCEQHAVFSVLETVERAEFGVQNDVKGCPDCKYTTINQTEWRPLGSDSERE